MLPAKAKAVKNVSMDGSLWCYFGNEQEKLTASYHPERWGDAALAHPEHGKERLAALSRALYLYHFGKKADCRREFARTLSKLPAMKESWFRQLVLELKK